VKLCGAHKGNGGLILQVKLLKYQVVFNQIQLEYLGNYATWTFCRHSWVIYLKVLQTLLGDLFKSTAIILILIKLPFLMLHKRMKVMMDSKSQNFYFSVNCTFQTISY